MSLKKWKNFLERINVIAVLLLQRAGANNSFYNELKTRLWLRYTNKPNRGLFADGENWMELIQRNRDR